MRTICAPAAASACPIRTIRSPTPFDDLKAQADPDNAGTDAFAKRYPKAVVRNFDGKPGMPTEMDALVAYLQMLGTLVDFKLYNEKANLR